MNILKTILPVSLYKKYDSINSAKVLRNWKKDGRYIPIPHIAKQEVIQYYQQNYGCNVLVETGTYLGEMVEAQLPFFKKIYSVELGVDLWKKAVAKFKKYNHVELLQGDSAKVLSKITEHLNEPTLFWLDGHYSSGITARGDTDCPIFGEIDAIFSFKKLNHVILIDDARLFNGEGDYPTTEKLTEYVLTKNPNYKLSVKDDIIRFTI